MSDIELVQLHDAKVAALQVGINGVVRISFAHLLVYERLSGRLAYDVSSYAAEMVAEGTTEVVAGLIDQPCYVTWMGRNGTEISDDELLAMTRSPAEGGTIELRFSGGQTAKLVCSSLSLQLGTRQKTLEVWEGAL
jgi:hypothetical protein